jgi:hypothetical protein
MRHKYVYFTANCTVLILRQVDFASVLQKTLQEQLDKCKEAMKMFPYFDAWSDATVMECCALSKMERYELDQIILGNTMEENAPDNLWIVQSSVV